MADELEYLECPECGEQHHFFDEGWGQYCLACGYEEIETLTFFAAACGVEHKDTIYRDAEVRILKWPNGEHYYAKMGLKDVVINGVQKWNTEDEARAAAKKYLTY